MRPPRYLPMLATPWPGPFDDDAWAFEAKWDGIRALVTWDGAVTITGRRGDDLTGRYPELTGLGGSRPFVVDGEIVSLGRDGRPSFEMLQQRIGIADPGASRRAAGETPVTLVAFDLLFDGTPLIDLPYRERRRRLEALRLPVPISEATVAEGTALFEAVRGRGLEGLVAKRLDSPYRPGVRSPDWRKIANLRTVRAVVGGFTAGEGGRRGTFGALVLGLWHEGTLRWIGSVGTGFRDRDLAAIRAALDEMATPHCPFSPHRDLPAATWVEPSLVASVGFREWTSAGRVRQPRFRGFTDDPVESVTWEAEGP